MFHFLLVEYTSVNRVSYDYAYDDENGADDWLDDNDIGDETTRPLGSDETHRNVPHRTHYNNIVDDNVSDMTYMPESDDSTEGGDDDTSDHGLFKRDLRAQFNDFTQTFTRPNRTISQFNGDRTKRQQNIVVRYQWFRNEQLLRDGLNGKELYVFTNGTLRIGYDAHAVGQYRCMASAIGLGRVLSTSCHVQQASSKCTRLYLPLILYLRSLYSI